MQEISKNNGKKCTSSLWGNIDFIEDRKTKKLKTFPQRAFVMDNKLMFIFN